MSDYLPRISSKAKVVVFMPTFNSQTYLVEALESILLQSFRDFSLVIYDGGSTDLTLSICRELAVSDPRIKIEFRPGTTPIQRLNDCLKNTDADFLFLAHSDDVQHSERLSKQLEYFDRNPNVVMAGTNTFYWLHDFKNDWARIYSDFTTHPSSHEEIKAQLIFWWCFANPSLGFRVKFFQANNLYMSEKYKFASDYLFYWEVSEKGIVGNLNEPLVGYRHHSSSEGPRNREALDIEVAEIRRLILKKTGLDRELTEDQIKILFRLQVEGRLVRSCPDKLNEYEALFEVIRSFYRRSSQENAGMHCLDLYLIAVLAAQRGKLLPYLKRKKMGLRRRWNRLAGRQNAY